MLTRQNYRKIADDEIVIKADIKCVDSTTEVNVIEFFAKHNAKVREETVREILQTILDESDIDMLSNCYKLKTKTFNKIKYKYGIEFD
jgi:hypothetical protein